MRCRSAAALTATAALALTACSALGGGGTQPTPAAPPPSDQASVSTPSSSSSPAPSASSTPSTGATPADPGQPSAADSLGPAVATRSSVVQHDRAELVMYALVRNGSTSQLNFTVRRLSARSAGYSVGPSFGDGNADAGDWTANTVDGVQLVDGKHAKLYLVASDGHGKCVCSRELLTVQLDENPTLFSATFAAPPADVTAVDVRVPKFGTITRVPVR